MRGRLVLVAVLVATLAGTASAASNPREPKRRFNAADQARARAIMIQRNDLGAGDWRVEADQSHDDSNAPAGCKNPNMSDLVLTGEAETPDFSRNGSFVGSDADVWSSERDARIAWKRAVAYPFARCMAVALNKQGKRDPRVNLTILSSGRIPIGKLAPRTFTFRMRFRIKGPAATLAGRFSVYYFSRGRVDAALIVMSLGRPAQPVPEPLERRLATLIASRLKSR